MNKLKPKIIAFLFSFIVTFTLFFVASFFADLANATQYVVMGFFFTVGVAGAVTFMFYLAGVKKRVNEVYGDE